MAKQVPAAVRTVKWQEVEVPTVYSNTTGIGMTAFDINLVFGEIVRNEAESTLAVPRVRIVLSPEQAVNVAKMLTMVTETYRKVNGEIRSSGTIDVSAMSKTAEAQLAQMVNNTSK